MGKIKLLSLVVPAFKQEKTIVKNLQNLSGVLSTLTLKYEIIVVVDGFCDKTYDLLYNLKPKIKGLKIYGYEKNMGKGYAVKYGVEKAKGDIIGFIDAGMDIDRNNLVKFINHFISSSPDILIGSKAHPQSKVNYSLKRKILSKGYRFVIKSLFSLPVSDTQVGLKLFNRKVAKDVFSRTMVSGFAFDIEVLSIAISLGYKIEEAPISLKLTGQSSIKYDNYLKIIITMLLDTLRVWFRLNILNTYGNKKEVVKI